MQPITMLMAKIKMSRMLTFKCNQYTSKPVINWLILCFHLVISRDYCITTTFAGIFKKCNTSYQYYWNQFFLIMEKTHIQEWLTLTYIKFHLLGG